MGFKKYRYVARRVQEFSEKGAGILLSVGVAVEDLHLTGLGCGAGVQKSVFIVFDRLYELSPQLSCCL